MKKNNSIFHIIFISAFIISTFLFPGCTKNEPIDNSAYDLQIISQNYGDWVFMQRASSTADLYIGASEGIEISHQIDTSLSFELVKDLLGLSLGYTFTQSTLKISSVSKQINEGETIEFYYRIIENKFQLNSNDGKVNDIVIYSSPQYAYILFDRNMNVIKDTKNTPMTQEELNENNSSFKDESPPTTLSPATESTPASTSKLMHQFTNITSGEKLKYSSNDFKDNYGSTYNGGYVVGSYESRSYQILLDGTYKKFSAVYFVLESETSDNEANLYITLDDVEIYTISLNKVSEPVIIDIDLPADGRDFKLTIPGFGAISFFGWPPATCLSDAEFYY